MTASSNPFNVPPQGFYFCAGCTTTITWTPTTQGTVTLELMDMSKSDVGTVIASELDPICSARLRDAFSIIANHGCHRLDSQHRLVDIHPSRQR
jgi:hypothetical protein